jgi:hypothetical protein
VHVAVAYLFGVRKITDYPMSLLLVVDHIAEGDRLNFRAVNLQIASGNQNTQKGNGVAEVAGSGFFAATALAAVSGPLPK